MTKKKTPTTEREILGEKVEAYLAGVEKLQNRLGIEVMFFVNFPHRPDRPPLLGRFCSWVIRLKGGIIDTRFYLRK